jgi:hypothetical protein
MNDMEPLEAGPDDVFERPSGGLGATALLITGLALLGLAALGFIASIREPGTNQLALHLRSTLPTLLAIGALSGFWRQVRSPRRVAVTDDGLAVASRGASWRRPWSEIGSASIEAGSMNGRKFLAVTDTAGHTLAKLDQTFERFDDMADRIKARIDAKADDTADRLARRKAHRMGLLALGVGSVLMLAGVFLVTMAREERRAVELLATKGQPGEGEIIRRFVAPNGVTKRIEYSVQGTAARNVEIVPTLWDALDGVDSIPVIYVPDEPAISRLAVGEVDDDLSSGGDILIAILGGVLGLGLFTFGFFAWNGWDLAYDDRTRTWAVKRFGKIVRGGPKPSTTPSEELP